MKYGNKEKKERIEGEQGSVLHFIALLISLSTSFFGCSEQIEQLPPSWRVTFFPMGARIHLDANHQEPIKHIRVFGSGEELVAQLDLGGYPRNTESLYFRWDAGERYRFEITHDKCESTAKTAQAPAINPRGSIEIAIPYGTVNPNSPSLQNAVTEPKQLNVKSLVLGSSEMTATVLVRNGLEAPVTFHVVLYIPSVIQVLQAPSIWNSGPRLDIFDSLPIHELEREETTIFVASGKFTVEAEVWHSQFELKIPNEKLPDSAQIGGTVFFEDESGTQWNRSATLSLRSATVDEIAAQLSIEAISMPTDAAGVVDPRRRPDAIYYPRPLLGRAGRWFGAKAHPVDYFQPIAYQTVTLRNHGQDVIHVIVEAMNLDSNRGEPVVFLAPPDAINAGTNRSVAFASLAGGSTTAVPLPIYFNPESARAKGVDFIGTGRYDRVIEIKIWGSDTTILRATRPLIIVTPNLYALFVTGFAIGATGLGLFFLLRFHRGFFNRFSTRQLILITLFGTTIFIAVSVPVTLLSNLTAALFGPISFLINGLINEILYYSLLTSLLMLIPKSGVITLVSAVRLLLGSVTLGLFTPIALLYTGMIVLLLEFGFLISQRGRNLFILALVFGICDALGVYTDFQLSITLHRLFYANWYILTMIVVSGFTYTFIGVLLGRQLSWGLQRVVV